MHIKWDVPKGMSTDLETVYRSFFNGIKMYTFMNLQTAVLYFILGFCNHNERYLAKIK